MATGSELRKHHRYNLPAEVKVANAETPLTAAARDISAEGIYFNVSADLQPGSELEFILDFPAELVDGAPPRIRCRGRVLRVERGDAERMGVAATIDHYDWVRE